MATTNQPSALPTNKLTAALLGQIIGAVGFGILAYKWPFLSEITVGGVGDLSMASQLLVAGALGYIVKDRPNV